MDKNKKKTELVNQRLKDKIVAFVAERYKDPSDIVSAEEVTNHIKNRHSEF